MLSSPAPALSAMPSLACESQILLLTALRNEPKGTVWVKGLSSFSAGALNKRKPAVTQLFSPLFLPAPDSSSSSPAQISTEGLWHGQGRNHNPHLQAGEVRLRPLPHYLPTLPYCPGKGLRLRQCDPALKLSPFFSAYTFGPE